MLALPSDHAAKVELRTQQVIAEETGVANVIDPLGGSWFVESLTDEVERQVEEVFATILDMGDDGTVTSGLLAGIEEGWFMAEIAESAFVFQNRLDKGRYRQVGVNAHVDDDDEHLDILRISNEVGTRQAARVAAVREGRDPGRHADALAAMVATAGTEANMLPSIMDAVRADATVGEISHALQDVWGTYTETPRI